MKSIYRLGLVLCAIMLTLTACGPVYQTSYSLIPPKGANARMCIMQCNQGKMMCQQACQSRISACKNQAHTQALYEYEEYKSQQVAAHQPVKRDVESFDDAYSCDESCSCEANYRSCFTSCGGKVIPHTRCVAFCGKGGGDPIGA